LTRELLASKRLDFTFEQPEVVEDAEAEDLPF
jgi:hypothetical protein